MIIPTTLKDLAKNPLEKEYKATFVTIASAELAAIKFAVSASFPVDKETLKPIQNPGVSFNRPVETFSLLKGATIDPAVNGYWEVSGARAVFIHKEPLTVGRTYTVTLPKTVADLAGAGLEKRFQLRLYRQGFRRRRQGEYRQGTTGRPVRGNGFRRLPVRRRRPLRRRVPPELPPVRRIRRRSNPRPSSWT